MGGLYKLPTDFKGLLDRKALKFNDVQGLAGLGWHAPSFGSYIFFLLATLELRAPLETLPLVVPDVWPVDSDDSDNERAPSPNTKPELKGKQRRIWRLKDPGMSSGPLFLDDLEAHLV